MQSVEIQGLDRVAKALEDFPGVIREARAEVMESMGEELLEGVQRRIGGTGRVAGVQEYRVGSGKGYVAVRPMADTELDGYAAGYVTNALEGGHEIAGSGDRVPGKFMYRRTHRTDSERLAETAAQRIEDAAFKALEGRTT